MVSSYRRADKILVTNQALKRLEPNIVRSRKGHEYALGGAGSCLPSQCGVQGSWKGSAGSAEGPLGTETPYHAAFPKVHICGKFKVQRKY